MTETGKNPLGPTGDQVRANVLRLRTKQGLSKKRLSDLVANLGRTIPPLGIARLESGDRRVDADDLIALALALGVNPSALLLPAMDSPSERVMVTGLGSVAADEAWDWADGRGRLDQVCADPGAAELLYQLYARPPMRRKRPVRPGEEA